MFVACCSLFDARCGWLLFVVFGVCRVFFVVRLLFDVWFVVGCWLLDINCVLLIVELVFCVVCCVCLFCVLSVVCRFVFCACCSFLSGLYVV